MPQRVLVTAGASGIVTLILAVLALIPIVYATYSYFAKRPVIRYQIANKKIARDGSEYLYQCLIGFMTKKGSATVNAFYSLRNRQQTKACFIQKTSE